MNMGQCFNWCLIDNVREPSWIGVLGPDPLIVRQLDQCTQFINLGSRENYVVLASLNAYFQLDHDLPSLYKKWGSGCPRMKSVTERLQGVRVVRQDPWECLISFICSSNNNISRITQMLDKLRNRYGTYLGALVRRPRKDNGEIESLLYNGLPVDLASTISDASFVWIPADKNGRYAQDVSSQDASDVEKYELYAFPTVDALAQAQEDELRRMGMGYRAKFIIGAAQLVKSKCDAIMQTESGRGYLAAQCERGEPWFAQLRAAAVRTTSGGASSTGEPKKQKVTIKREVTDSPVSGHNSGEQGRTANEARLYVQQQLMELPGVGRKVADCVALFSLDQTAAVPVDTHVWNIAIRDYAAYLRTPGVAENNGGVRGGNDDKSENANMKKAGKRKKPTGNTQITSPATPAIDDVTTPLSGLASPPLVGMSDIETRSVTPAVYEQVGDVFRMIFGDHAGWAHSVLFAAELPQFRALLPEAMQQEMLAFSAQQRSAKKSAREEKATNKADKSKVGDTEMKSIDKGTRLTKHMEDSTTASIPASGVKRKRVAKKASL
jgi:N-glycosylase/DNA lyase